MPENRSYFFLKLIPCRPTFAMDMTDEERAVPPYESPAAYIGCVPPAGGWVAANENAAMPSPDNPAAVAIVALAPPVIVIS